jgi:hypothetical protein
MLPRSCPRIPTPSARSGGSNCAGRPTTCPSTNSILVNPPGEELTTGRHWWFASTTIPLLAATIGPLANVLSVAALASKWRVALPNNGQLPAGADGAGVDIADPRWVTILNAISLGFGVLGNLSLLFNFTKRIRYIIALPLTIVAWYIATGIV